MLIVDAQVHIWTSGTPVNIRRQVPAYTKDELLRDMDEAGVRAVVLHPPSWDARSNEVAIETARQHPDRLAVLGFFDVSRPEIRSLIDGWKNQPGMLGLRFAFLRPGEENWLLDGTADWLWPAAERAGLAPSTVANMTEAVERASHRYPVRLNVNIRRRPSPSVDRFRWQNSRCVRIFARARFRLRQATAAASAFFAPFFWS